MIINAMDSKKRKYQLHPPAIYNTVPQITSQVVWDTFEAVFEHRKRPTGLTFHSDQGCQYTELQFRKCLRQLGGESVFFQSRFSIGQCGRRIFLCQHEERGAFS